MNNSTPNEFSRTRDVIDRNTENKQTVREPSPLDNIAQKADAGNAYASFLYEHILHHISDILEDPTMQSYIHDAARVLQKELDRLLKEEVLVYEQIQQVSADLRRVADESYEEHQQGVEQHRAVVREQILIDVQQRDILTTPLRNRIVRSLDSVLSQADLDVGDSIQFIGYGATKDVFSLTRRNTPESREAIAIVYADKGTQIADILQEVEVSQHIDIPGIIRYRDVALLNAKGNVTTDVRGANRAIVRSEYVEGSDVSRAAQQMSAETRTQQFQEVVQASILESYTQSIEAGYKTAMAELDSKFAVYSDEEIFDTLLEQYAATFESILQRPLIEIQERLKAHIQKTIQKQKELYQTKQSEEDIGKKLLIRAIAARKLEDEVRKRADIYRKSALVQLAEQLALSADAIDALHRTGYVHQDIKPENIIGCGIENTDILKKSPTVIDLGSVAKLGSDGQVMKGTRRYMQPEGFGRYAGAIDAAGAEPRKDVRAFAISLFDTLSAALDIPQLTLFPPKEQDGVLVSGNTIVEGEGLIIPYYDEDITDKYTFLQSYLHQEVQLPYALLAIFDKHSVLDNGVAWEHTCKDMQQAFLAWIQSCSTADIDRIRLVFSELADPKMFIKKYSEYKNR